MLNKIKKLNFIHPSFFLLFFWFLISGKGSEFVVFFLVLFIHELGHYMTAKKNGYKINRFYLTPTGACLSYESPCFLSQDEIKIALAGPMANLLCSVILTAFWWIFPAVYSLTCSIVVQGSLLALLNLLPAYPLDGGRIFVALLSEKISKINNLVLIIIFIVLFVISCFFSYNPTLALFAFFLLSGYIEIDKDIKYELANFYKKKTKNFSKAKILYIESDATLFDVIKKIQSNRHTLFYVKFDDLKARVVSEEQMIRLSMIYPLTKKINEILIQKK